MASEELRLAFSSVFYYTVEKPFKIWYTESETSCFYDAWGNFTVTYHNGGGSTSVTKNPLTYRGYYYDSDLGLYYLNARYYDSKVGRWINGDSALYHSMLGYNMFAYCNNNPVYYYDPTGESAAAALGAWLSGGGAVALAEPTLVGEIILVAGLGVIGAIYVTEKVKEGIEYIEEALDKADAPPQSITEPTPNIKDDEETSTPEIDYPGDDPKIAPKGYEWRGSGEQGSKKGNYYNPDKKTSLHPDLDHPDPIGPHWDYSGPEGKFRVFPDGRVLPK